MSLAPGTQVGPYIVEAAIARGGFAVVYRAYDPRVDSYVALKVLADNLALDPEIRERFADEGRALRKVQNESIVQLYDLGATPAGQPYLVMHYASAGTLETRLRSGEAPVGVDDLRQLVEFLADGLGAVHRAGFVHRDVKPSNVLIDLAPSAAAPTELFAPDETLLLGDFGLSKDLSISSGLTVGSGSPNYAAPEQRRPFAKVDRRVDVFGASAVLARVMCGAEPDADGDWQAVLDRHEQTPLIAAIRRGLSADPEDRHSTIETWRQSVLGSLAESSIEAGDTSTERSAGTGRSKRIAALASALAAMAAAVALVVWTGAFDGVDGPDPTEAVDSRLGVSLPAQAVQVDLVDLPADSAAEVPASIPGETATPLGRGGDNPSADPTPGSTSDSASEPGSTRGSRASTATSPTAGADDVGEADSVDPNEADVVGGADSDAPSEADDGPVAAPEPTPIAAVEPSPEPSPEPVESATAVPTAAPFVPNPAPAPSPTPIPSFDYQVASLEVTEGAAEATVRIAVTRSGTIGLPSTVRYATIDAAGSATAGSDFYGTSGTIEFQAGEQVRDIEITLLPDTVSEPVESILVRVFPADSGTTLAEGTITISDDDVDTSPLLLDSVTVGEAAGSVTLRVYRPTPGFGTRQVLVASRPGTATPGSDFYGIAETVTLGPGATEVLVTVQILDDGDPEPDETFFVRVTEAGTTHADATITITDDD